MKLLARFDWGQLQVNRGESWRNPSYYARRVTRIMDASDYRDHGVGFRPYLAVR
jgi:formylglycine-generating enzyme required for sulfatase activity